jgi:hypothetical protein
LTDPLKIKKREPGDRDWMELSSEVFHENHFKMPLLGAEQGIVRVSAKSLI